MLNTVTYAIWFTHRENWQDLGKPFADRTNTIKFIKAKQEELGLEFVKIKQAVEVSYDGEETITMRGLSHRYEAFRADDDDSPVK